MERKVLFFRKQNCLPDIEVDETLKKEARKGWLAISVKTETKLFGERVDEDYGKMPQHAFYLVTILLEKTK